jgi:hypothetical protein
MPSTRTAKRTPESISPVVSVNGRVNMICSAAGAAVGLIAGGGLGASFMLARNATFGASDPMDVGGFALVVAVLGLIGGWAAARYAVKLLPPGETSAAAAAKTGAGAGGLGVSLGGLLGVQLGAMGCVLGALAGGLSLGLLGAAFGALVAAVRGWAADRS